MPFLYKFIWIIMKNLTRAGYVGNNLGQGKNDYGVDGTFYGLFLAPKTKLCYTIDKYGTLGQKLTFKGFHDTKRLLNTDNYFKLNVNGEFSLACKRSFAHGITFDKKATTVEEFKSNVNESKHLVPDEFKNASILRRMNLEYKNKVVR